MASGQDLFRLDYFLKIIPKILGQLPLTLGVALTSFVCAIFIGFFVALVRQYKVKGLYHLMGVYISFFRSTPFIAQLCLFYYGLSQINEYIRGMSRFTAAVIVLSFSFSAYMSEDIRSAINSVEKGQYEAAVSIGMTPVQAMRRVVVPQAARVAIPGLSNSFINLFKSTAIVFYIGLNDMMGAVNKEISISFRYLECYAAAVVIYWIILSILAYGQGRLEKVMNRAY